MKIEEVDEIIFKNKDKNFCFFWNINENPFEDKDIIQWSPFDLEDQRVLRKAYGIYRLNQYYQKGYLKPPSVYYINFENMMQINKTETFRQRPVLREEPGRVKYVSRHSRFFHGDENCSQKPKINIFKRDEKIVNEKKPANLIKDCVNANQYQKHPIHLITIGFNVISYNFQKIKVRKEFCEFEDNYNISIQFNEFKKILEKEISDLGNLYDMTNSVLEYLHIIRSMENNEHFFEKIYKIYTEEGFLYRKLNEFLRNNYTDGIKKLQYYYLSLLASFEYASSLEIPNLIKADEDLILYRISRTSEEEMEEYEDSYFKNIIRVFNDFISTSRNKGKTLQFLNGIKSNHIGFLWEIRIPKKILKKNRKNFAFIENFSAFKGEEEVLIKSASVLLIEEIVPLHDSDLNRNNNIYLKKCRIKEFDILKYLKSIRFGNSVTEIDLQEAHLGNNIENIKLIYETVKDSKSIALLNLRFNNLGSNPENLVIINQIIKENKSIKELMIGNNELGCNPKNLENLFSEGFKENKTILVFGIGGNILGYNQANLNWLCNGLKDNGSIRTLRLGKNDLMKNGHNVNILCEGLKGHKSIKEIVLKLNDLGANEKNKLRSALSGMKLEF